MVMSVSFLGGKPGRVLRGSATRGPRSVAASAAGGECRQGRVRTTNRCTWSPPPRDPHRRRPAPPAAPLRGSLAAGGGGERRPSPDSPRGHRRRCRLGAWCLPTITARLGTPLAQNWSARRPARRTDHRGIRPLSCRRPRWPPRQRPGWPCPASADRAPGGWCPSLRPLPPVTARRSLVGRGGGRLQPEPAHRWPGHGDDGPLGHRPWMGRGRSPEAPPTQAARGSLKTGS
jgi:hypothetical protein